MAQLFRVAQRMACDAGVFSLQATGEGLKRIATAIYSPLADQLSNSIDRQDIQEHLSRVGLSESRLKRIAPYLKSAFLVHFALKGFRFVNVILNGSKTLARPAVQLLEMGTTQLPGGELVVTGANKTAEAVDLASYLIPGGGATLAAIVGYELLFGRGQGVNRYQRALKKEEIVEEIAQVRRETANVDWNQERDMGEISGWVSVDPSLVANLNSSILLNYFNLLSLFREGIAPDRAQALCEQILQHEKVLESLKDGLLTKSDADQTRKKFLTGLIKQCPDCIPQIMQKLNDPSMEHLRSDAELFCSACFYMQRALVENHFEIAKSLLENAGPDRMSCPSFFHNLLSKVDASARESVCLEVLNRQQVISSSMVALKEKQKFVLKLAQNSLPFVNESEQSSLVDAFMEAMSQDSRLYGDKELMTYLACFAPQSAFEKAEWLKGDEGFMEEVLVRASHLLDQADAVLNKGMDYMARLVRRNPELMSHMTLSLMAQIQGKSVTERAFILELLKKSQCLEVISFASEELKEDPEFLIDAAKNDERVFAICGQGPLEDSEAAKKLLKKNGFAFSALSDELKSDPDFLREVLGKGSAPVNCVLIGEVMLDPACEEAREQKDFFRKCELKEVRKYAGISLDSTERELFRRVRKEGVQVLLGSEDWGKDPIKLALRVDFGLYLPLVQIMAQFNAQQKSLLEGLLQEDLAFIGELAVEHPEVLRASQKATQDRAFMLHLAKQNIQTLKFLSDSLKKDLDFFEEVATVHGDSAYNHAHRDIDPRYRAARRLSKSIS